MWGSPPSPFPPSQAKEGGRGVRGHCFTTVSPTFSPRFLGVELTGRHHRKWSLQFSLARHRNNSPCSVGVRIRIFTPVSWYLELTSASHQSELIDCPMTPNFRQSADCQKLGHRMLQSSQMLWTAQYSYFSEIFLATVFSLPWQTNNMRTFMFSFFVLRTVHV